MLTFIQPFDDIDSFPPLEKALKEPNGLLALGGDLSPERLLKAYQQGIFPWFNEGDLIQWWSPDPRLVLYPAEFHSSRSLKKNIKRCNYEFSINQAFDTVIHACAAPREYANSTWITGDMIEAYNKLHQMGFAHSVEIWSHGKLVGGLYGLAFGKIFFGESMFNLQTDASKSAFMVLSRELEQQGFALIDCQVPSEHLKTMGAREIDRPVFKQVLAHHCQTINPVNLTRKKQPIM